MRRRDRGIYTRRLTVGDSVCEQCGFAIPGDVHLSLYLEEVS